MKYILLLLAMLMFSTNAPAHEVKPPPMKEACDAAKWLGNELAARPLYDPGYDRIKWLTEKAFDECEGYQEQVIDWAEFERDVDAAIERASKAVTKCE